jgi:hypothetical protein
MSNNKDFKVKNGIKPTVYHEAVGTVVSGSGGYNLVGASYDSVSFSVGGQEAAPYGISFNDTGSKMYVIGAGSDSVFQYSLSPPYDITTASYDNVSFSVASQETLPTDITFSADGTKMYIVSFIGDTVFQYGLTSAFDVSTASYDSVSFSVSSQATAPASVLFNTVGTKMYILDDTSDTIYQYTLSTAWDVSTASYSSVSFSLASQATSTYGFAFKPDGTKLFVSDSDSDSVYEYSLSTSYDISTLSYSGESLDVSSQGSFNPSIIFNGNGTKMFLLGQPTDTIYQYSTSQPTASLDLSTGNVFEITPTSDIQVSLTNPAASGTSSGATLLLDGVVASAYDLANASYDSVSFSVASQETTPAFVRFKTDGTKMYVGGSGNDTVYQYSLSTAWDTSTSSYDSKSFSVASQENNLRGLYIKPDGTKFYTIGIQADVVYQYSMSTAWDVSTASYDNKSFSVSSQEGEAQGISFKQDGTKMFIVGSLGDEVNEYSLSTAWDVSSSSFTTNFVISGQDTNPNDIYFKPDGAKFWVTGDTNNTVFQYSCSTAWDISTASYDSVSFSVATQDGGPGGISFGNSGTKMYVVGTVNDTVFQYSTGSATTITYDSALQFSGGTAPTSPDIGDTDVITFNTTDGGTTYKAALAIDGAK